MLDALSIHETLVESQHGTTRMLLSHASHKPAPRPIAAGWTLAPILVLDEANAGFLRFMHRASALRRQGVYLALTQLDCGRPHILASAIRRAWTGYQCDRSSPLSVIASGLMTMRAGDVIHAVFGSTPNGFLVRSRDAAGSSR
jgi:hypothetical protein